jgi:tetratricopeptide (TPR) repeat protein/tRNA A-37 threonylcarbamoyl transferase component Bud32
MASPEVAQDQECGRYRILRPHAQGGLGEVFLAQDTQIERQIALKEIRRDLAASEIRKERFLLEARITGMLEHPGIVPVYGIGTHEDGRAYYAMRFIKGETLRTAVERFHAGPKPDFAGLEFRHLLARFVSVCNTMAYAHSQGVLHRDLKPCNVMLGDFGETLVVDWGLAKPIAESESTESGEGGEHVPVTRNVAITAEGQAVGSPAFMSPEQASGESNQLGPASDIYNLGATLYVMLTDRMAFEGGGERLLQQVRRGDFPGPRQINPRIPHALEAICLRAMVLDPKKRYRSALELAREIECWLADRQVSAYREPRLQRARRWVRQHQNVFSGLIAALTVGFLALATAVPVLSLAWRRAEVERYRAEKSLAFLVKAFRKPDPALDGRALKVADLLGRAESDIDEAFANDPLAKAALLQAIGETYSGLGLPAEAHASLERVTELLRQAIGPDDPRTLVAMYHQAGALQDVGRIDQAISMFESVLARQREQLGPKHHDTLETTNDLAVAYWESGQPARAIPLYEAVLAHTRATAGDDDAETLLVMDNLAVALAAAGEPLKAIPLHEAALVRARATLGEESPQTLITMNNLARALELAGRHDQAISLYETTLAKLRPTLGDDHPHTLTLLSGLAQSSFAAGQHSRAIGIHEEVLAKRTAKLGSEHPDTLGTMFALAKARFAANQPEQAVPLAVDFVARAVPIRDRLPLRLRAQIPEAARLLADHFKKLGRLDDAERYRALSKVDSHPH